MNLKHIIYKCTEERILGKIAVGVMAALLLATGTTAVANRKSGTDCPCNGTCPCHYEAAPLQSDVPAEGIGREVTVKDIGCPDWNLNSSIVGWDGRMMESWEFDLFARIFYLEFWGSSDVLCEAGCDAMLRLWETEEFGKTIGDLLTAKNASGTYVYDPYAYVWTWTYDQEGLEWCREFCMSRFLNGPTWTATYFQKYGYPDWGKWSPIPCYEIDGIYFSIASH